MSLINDLKNRNNFLYKDAGEGSLQNNIKQLITDEAYTQISQKFPKLVPNILGINIIEMIDQDNAIGGAIISLGDTRLTIPIVYYKGIVDATTFLYDEEQDNMLALTKKIIDVLLEPVGSLGGESFKPGMNQTFDSGNVNSMFVPPKTYNPKIASSNGGILFAIMENSDIIKTAMISNLKDPSFRDAFEDIYGTGAAEHIATMEKTARRVDNTPPEALFSISEIKNSHWIKKEAAILEYGKNGYVISHGADTQTKSLEKAGSVEDGIKKIIGENSIEGIDTHKQGIFTAYSMGDLKPIEIARVRNLNSSSSELMTIGAIRIPGDQLTGGNPIVGKQVNISDSSILKPMSSLDSMSGSVAIMFIKDGEITGAVSVYKTEDSIKRSLGGTQIQLPLGRVSLIKIEKNSDAKPTTLGSTLYVGDKNVRISPRHLGEEVRVVKMRDLDGKLNQNGEIVKVAFDGVDYTYNGAVFSKPSLVNQMIGEGFDKNSIYHLVKTATNDGGAELIAVNAKLDMLTSMIMNLAGQVQGLTQAQQMEQPQMPMEEMQPQQPGLAGQEPPMLPPEAMPPQDGTAMVDPNSGMPTEQQMAAQDQAAQAQAAQDQQLLQQQPAPMDQYAAQGTMPPPGQEQMQEGMMPPEQGQMQDPAQEQGQPPLQDGMNTAIDPTILATLAELKDSSVMDVGLISMISSDNTMSQVMNEYKGNILEGASSVGRILFNALVKRDELIVNIGEKKYKQLEKNLRVIFIRMSDLYADIMKMRLESDGKMAA